MVLDLEAECWSDNEVEWQTAVSWLNIAEDQTMNWRRMSSFGSETFAFWGVRNCNNLSSPQKVLIWREMTTIKARRLRALEGSWGLFSSFWEMYGEFPWNVQRTDEMSDFFFVSRPDQLDCGRTSKARLFDSSAAVWNGQSTVSAVPLIGWRSYKFRWVRKLYETTGSVAIHFYWLLPGYWCWTTDWLLIVSEILNRSRAWNICGRARPNLVFCGFSVYNHFISKNS